MPKRAAIDVRLSLTVLPVVLSIFVFSCTPALARPEVFADLSLSQAQERGRQTKKLVIADFTASWCGPCRLMDERTWVDDEVVAWIKQNAVAVQIDVDEDKAIAQQFAVRSMPTVIIFAPPDTAKEAARDVGFQEPADLMPWLEAVQSGKAKGQVDPYAMEIARGKGGKWEVEARLRHSDTLMHEGDYDGALNEYIWLWQNMEKEAPKRAKERTGSLAAQMAQLLDRYPQAKGKIDYLREDAREHNRMSDWVVLNEVLNEQDETLKWFDSVKDDASKRQQLAAMGRILTDLLLERGRFSGAGNLFENPLAELQDRYKWAEEIRMFDPEQAPVFSEQAALIYRSLLAAGRKNDAAQVAEESIKLENSPRMRERLEAAARETAQVPPVSNFALMLALCAATIGTFGLLFFLRRKKSEM